MGSVFNYVAPAYGLDDSLRAEGSSARADLKFHVATSDPRLFFRCSGGAAGALTAHVGDAPDCGEPGTFFEGAQIFGATLLGERRATNKNFAHVGMEATQANNAPIQMPMGHFTNAPNPIPTNHELWASRPRPLSMEDVRIRQCKLGKLRWPATVPWPDVRARLARLAARVNSLPGRDMSRTNDLVKTLALRKTETPKYASSSHRSELARGDADEKMLTCGPTTLAGRSDAALGGQTAGGNAD